MLSNGRSHILRHLLFFWRVKFSSSYLDWGEQKATQGARYLALLGCNTAINSETYSSVLCKVWAKSPVLEDLICLRMAISSHKIVPYNWSLDFCLGCFPSLTQADTHSWGGGVGVVGSAPLQDISSPSSACLCCAFGHWLRLQYFLITSQKLPRFICLFMLYLTLPSKTSFCSLLSRTLIFLPQLEVTHTAFGESKWDMCYY